MRESDHYFFRPTRFASISVCPYKKETDSRSIWCWMFASFLRLVKVHATRPNKYRKSDGITVTFGVYAFKVEQLTRAQLWNVNFNKKRYSLSRDYSISSRILQTQLTLIPKVERIYRRICALAKRRDYRESEAKQTRFVPMIFPNYARP